MATYRIVIGTRDPEEFTAPDDADAVTQAVAIVHARYGDDLAGMPQEVATLMGPAGLVTRPSERIDEFVRRVDGAGPAGVVQPGDSNTPDCNGD